MKPNIHYLWMIVIALLAIQVSCKKSATGPEPPPPEQPPVINSIDPDRALAGDEITINGENFSATASENTIKFAGAVTTPSNASTTQLTVTVPDQAITGPITVEVNGLSGSSTADFVRLYKPVVNDFTPTNGKYGTQVTITGEHFNTDPTQTVVAFNLMEANILSLTETEIVAEVPKGAGSGPVLVVNKEVQHGTQGPGEFSYELKVTVSTVAGTGSAGYSDGDGAVAQFNKLTGIDIDKEGNLYIADSGNHVIRRVSTEGQVSTIAGTGTAGFKNGSATEAQFNYPHDLALDGEGNIYIADASNNRIRKIFKSTLEVITLSGSGNPGFVDGSDASLTEFDFPTGIVAGDDGNIYVADRNNHAIRKISEAGGVTTLAGSGSAGFSDGIGNSALFNRPVKIDFSDQHLYVTDLSNHRLRKINLETSEVTTYTGTGNNASADGPIDQAEHSYPFGISDTQYWGMYAGDDGSSKIRLITNDEVKSISGDGGGYVDGDGSTAKFKGTVGIAAMIVGNSDWIYISDWGNHVIRKITVE